MNMGEPQVIYGRDARVTLYSRRNGADVITDVTNDSSLGTQLSVLRSDTELLASTVNYSSLLRLLLTNELENERTSTLTCYELNY